MSAFIGGEGLVKLIHKNCSLSLKNIKSIYPQVHSMGDFYVAKLVNEGRKKWKAVD